MNWLAPLALVALVSGPLGCGAHGTNEAKASEAAPSAAPGASNETTLTEAQLSKGNFKVEPVATRELGALITTSGRVTFDDLHVSHVFSPVTGRVTEIKAELGTKVKKGDELAVIDSPDIGIAVSDMGKANADLIAAEHDYKRQKELYEAHAASARDYETSEDNYRKARAEMDRAQQKARLLHATGANAARQSYSIRALIDGEVINRTTTPGIEVQGQYSGGASQELFTIGSLDPIWVLADVYEMDLGRIQPGARVVANVVSFAGKDFVGKVDWVSGSLDPTSRTVKVRCIIKNDDMEHRLKPEMFATVKISAPGKLVLAVPRSSILHLGETTVAFFQVGSGPNKAIKFERRPVTVDEEETGDYIPVLEGAKAGDQLVTSGALLLSGTL